MSNKLINIISEVGTKVASMQADCVTTLFRSTLWHSDKNSYILSVSNSTIWERIHYGRDATD